MAQTELAARVFRYYVTGEVCLDLVWSKAIDRTLVQTAYLRNQICALLDELTLGLLVELMIQLALEFFKLDNFCMLHCLDAIQGRKLVFSLSCQLGLYILNERIQLLDSILLSLLNFLNRSLHLTDVVLEVAKPSTQAASLSTNQINMLLVDLFELLKLMMLVLITKETTVRADWDLACFAVIAQSCVMLLA